MRKKIKKRNALSTLIVMMISAWSSLLGLRVAASMQSGQQVSRLGVSQQAVNRRGLALTLDSGMVGLKSRLPLSKPLTSRKDTRPWIGRESYEDVCTFNDLSYAVTALTAPRVLGLKDPIVRAERDQFFSQCSQLSSKGWSLWFIEGLSANRRDFPAVLGFHPNRLEIVLAFHGTKGWFDWVSNFDRKLESLKEHLQSAWFDVPDSLKMHRGYLKILASVEVKILSSIQSIISNLSDEDRRKVQIVVTGHSKGAALALAATGMIQSFLKQWSTVTPSVTQVKALLFSMPRGVLSKAAKGWLAHVLPEGQVVRIVSKGDFVEWFSVHGEQALDGWGIKLEDCPKRIHRRLHEISAGVSLSSFVSHHSAHHYVSSVRFPEKGYSFDARLLPTYEDLKGKFPREKTEMSQVLQA